MFSGIVLAGGKSKRMGTDKRRVTLSGMSLLEFSVNRLRNVSDEVLVVIGEKEDLGVKDVRFVLDVEKDGGPMVGLFSGLYEMKNFYGLVTPVDNPLIPSGFLGYLKEKALGHDLTVPRWERGIEPLIAVYSKDLLPAMKEWIRKGKKLALHLFARESNIKVRFIEEGEISKFGDPEILFFNVNTERDLRKAERLTGKSHERCE